jgi:hypothetical protein
MSTLVKYYPRRGYERSEFLLQTRICYKAQQICRSWNRASDPALRGPNLQALRAALLEYPDGRQRLSPARVDCLAGRDRMTAFAWREFSTRIKGSRTARLALPPSPVAAGPSGSGPQKSRSRYSQRHAELNSRSRRLSGRGNRNGWAATGARVQFGRNANTAGTPNTGSRPSPARVVLLHG